VKITILLSDARAPGPLPDDVTELFSPVTLGFRVPRRFLDDLQIPGWNTLSRVSLGDLSIPVRSDVLVFCPPQSCTAAHVDRDTDVHHKRIASQPRTQARPFGHVLLAALDEVSVIGRPVNGQKPRDVTGAEDLEEVEAEGFPADARPIFRASFAL